MKRNERSPQEDGDLVHHTPSAKSGQLTLTGHVDFASWLSDDILLILGWFPAEAETDLDVTFITRSKTIPCEARFTSYSRPEIPHAEGYAGKAIVLRFLHAEDVRELCGSLVVRNDSTIFALNPLNLSEVVTDLQTLIHGSIARWKPDVQLEIMDFLAGTLKEDLGTTNALQLSRNLFLMQEMLREKFPPCMPAPDQPQCLCIESILAIDETSFYIEGWVRDAQWETTHFTAISPEGSRTELGEKLFRFPRPDVEQFYNAALAVTSSEKFGFISYFEVEAPSYLSTGWVIEMQNEKGTKCDTTVPTVIRDRSLVRKMIIEDISHAKPLDEELILHHTFPALRRLKEQYQERDIVESVKQFGVPNESPEISIIVTLYQRIDFLTQQLAQFVFDPQIRETDLIYVLDSPELAEELDASATNLSDLYRVPFRVVALNQNSGYSAANNAGISFARGRLLLLLNSDVLPDKPGWLGTMKEFYDATPQIGALGPKLIYEDDSLQHAGLYFSRLSNSRLWENRHYFKGFHRNLPAANVARHVPAVTGACLMIDKELYEQVGGLQDSYVQADYEDSDLCLRLIVKGYDNWYLPAAELYHLEGQSIPDAARHLNTRYNLWLHTYLWNDVIEAVMAACDSALAGNVPLAGTEGRSWRSAIAGRLDSDALARHDFLPASLQLQRARKTEGAEKSPDSMSETPDEVNLYLQTCVKTKGPNGNTDERRVPVMNDLGSLMGCSLSQTESVKQIPFETKSHSSTNSKKNVDDRTRKQRIVGFEKAEREKGLEGSRLRPKVKELTSDELQTHTTIRRLQAVLEEAKCKSSEVLRCASIKWIREAVAEVVPADTTVLVVSRGDTLLLDLAGRTAWHFPQGAGGFYAGYHPADSRAAITHLEQLRAAGAAYLLFPLTSFWWLDYYAEFSQYLNEHYCRIWDNERCIIYSLAQLGSGRTQVQQDRSFWQRAVRRASLLLGRA